MKKRRVEMSSKESTQDLRSRQLVTMSNGVIEHQRSSEFRYSTSEWLTTVLNLLRDFGILKPDRDREIIHFEHPSALQKKLKLSLDETCDNDEKIVEIFKNVIQHSVATGHPHFHNQLYGGTDPYGLAASVVTECLNTNQVTFEVAPAFILIEHEVFNKLFRMVGYESGDGMFSPGGSISNMYGMVLARYKKSPDTKTKGLYCIKTLVAFISEDAHYSISKGINWLGIGTDNLIKVKVDSNGRMIPEDLEKKIIQAKKEDKIPFFVCATAGTTVLGAFDPISKIADVCQEHDVWLHVDACWGGSLIFSRTHKKILNGIHRADSISWNPHKMLGAPLQCSVFLTKHKGILHRCNCASATYLFQQDKFYDVSFDTGDMSLQCGRKVDAFKLWLMWKARGDLGFEKLVDQAMSCSEYFNNKISDRPGFVKVMEEFECTNICFWYVPKRMRGLEKTEEWWDKLSQIAPKIKENLTYAGTLMIGYQPLKHRNLRNFFRFVNTCHPERTYEDMDYVIKQIEIHGENL